MIKLPLASSIHPDEKLVDDSQRKERFRLHAISPEFFNVGFPFTITALTPNGTIDVGYSGTVHFTSTDTGAILPGPATLVSGIGFFSATLETLGTQIIIATDHLIRGAIGIQVVSILEGASQINYINLFPNVNVGNYIFS